MPRPKSNERKAMENMLDKKGLITDDGFLINPRTGYEIEPTIRNIRYVFQQNIEKKFKTHKTERKKRERKRIVQDEKKQYSSTIYYKEEQRWKQRNDSLSRWYDDGQKYVNSRQIGKLSKRQARQILRNMEDRKNQSFEMIRLTLISVENVKIDEKKTDLRESKMYRCKYKIFSEKIAEWTDAGNGECVYDYLIHRYKRLKLTKERIYDTMFEKEYDLEKKKYYRNYAKGVNTYDLERFCKYFRITLYAVNRDELLFHKYIAPNKNKKYGALCYICSNNHLYPIKEKKYICTYSNIARETLKTSKTKEEKKKERKKKRDGKQIMILDIPKLDDKLETMLFEEKVMPKAMRVSNKITRIETDKEVFIACPEKEKMEKYCKLYDIKFEGQTIPLISKQLFEKLYPKHTLSVLNPIALQMFLSNNKNAFVHKFRKPEHNELDDLSAVDIAKCYTSILKDNTYEWPIFSVTDDLEPYDGKELKCGFYWVESKNFFPLKKSGWYCYSTLLQARKFNIDFKITHQLIASNKLPPNYFVKFVTESLKCQDFKNLNNMLVGILNKICDKCSTCTYTTDFNEAGYRFFNDFKENKLSAYTKIPHVRHFGSDIFEINTVNHSKKYEINVPLYQMVLESGWMKAYELYTKLGGELIMVKTDCVIVKNPKNEVPYDPNGIGTYREEKINRKCFDRINDVVNSRNEYKGLEWDDIEEEQYTENEYDVKGCIERKIFPWVDIMAQEIMDSKKGYSIQGMAGTGKSYLIKKLNKICEENGYRYINLAPTNKAALNIGGSTIHKFFGIATDEVTISAKKLNKLTNYKYVFIDEIGAVSSNLLAYINLIKIREPNIKIICVGDKHQLPPVMEKHHTDSSVLKFICDCNKLTLNIIKRSDDSIPRIAKRWYYQNDIDLTQFGSCETERYLSFTNKTRKRINKQMMLKKQRRNFRARHLKLERNPNDNQSQKMILMVETPIICRENCKKRNLINNEEFKVLNFNKNTEKIFINREEDNEFTYDEFRKYFLPAYCITIHKSQGQTYDEMYNICDVPLIMRHENGRELLYTALTRARKMHQIKIYRGEGVEHVIDSYSYEFLERKANHYHAIDAANDRCCDISISDLNKHIHSHGNICHICRSELNEQTFTLDRIDNNFGHMLDNCLPCCVNCNRARRNVIINEYMA